MEIFRRLAGYSLGQADLIRRAISKKKAEVLLREKEKFVAGCLKNGISEEISASIFSEIEDFASYAFNKSHAACYSVVAYQTAYLKCYYPAQFYAALISSYMTVTDKVAYYIQSAEEAGIRVMPPSIHSGEVNFTVRNHCIIFGLTAIKGIGKQLATAIVEERENGDYTSLEDFIKRLAHKQLNKRAMEALIKAGCFDDFGSRSEFLDCYEHHLDHQSQTLSHNVAGQLDLMGMLQEPSSNSAPAPAPTEKQPYQPDSEDLKLEKEVLGLYISGHPLRQFEKKLKSMGSDSLPKSLEEFRETENTEKTYTFIGVIANLNIRTTKAGNRMAFFTLESLTGNISCIAFSEFFIHHTDAIIEDNIVVATGKFTQDSDDTVKMIITRLDRFDTNLTYKKVYLRVPSETAPVMAELKKLLTFFSGTTPVYVYFEENKRLTQAPKSLWVSENDILTEKLIALLGEKNVKIVND